MRRALDVIGRWVGLALVLSVAALLTGCTTGSDTENLSERPWNAPKSWEGGMPSSLFEGR